MPTHDDLIVHKGQLVKSVDGGFVEGILVPFTGPDKRDLHGEYFDDKTELSFDLLGAPVLYHHGRHPKLGRTAVGKFVEAKVTEAGIWVRAKLDMANEYARKLYEAAKNGALAWSSGAEETALVDGDGYIRRWPVIEGSLTGDPAMPFATRVTAKSLSASIPNLKELEEAKGDADAIDTEDATGAQPENATHHKESDMDALAIVAAIAKRMGANLTGEDLAAIAAEIGGAAPADAEVVSGADEAMLADPARNAPIKSAAERLGTLAADRIRISQATKSADLFADIAERSVAALSNSRVPAGSARGSIGGNGSGNPAPGRYNDGRAPAEIDNLRIKSRLGNVSPSKLSFGLDMNRMLKQIGSNVRVRFSPRRDEQAVALNLAKSIFAAQVVEAYEKGEFDLEPKQYEKSLDAARHFSKANELDNTGQTGYGLEWVPEAWASQIWPRARRENVVLSRISSFEMTAPIHNWPTDGADGAVKMVSELTDAASFNDPVTVANVSKLPTAEVIFNTGRKKFQRQIGWTREEIEDSIIKFDSQADSQAMQSMIDAFESVILNGDTETGTTNINYDDGTPAATDVFLMWDGIIKYALANTGVDMGTDAPTYSKFVDMLYKMNPEIAGDEKDTVIFTHAPVYGKLIQIDEFVTFDVVGSPGANVTGRVPYVAGVPILRTQQLAKSATNGKINDTGGSNLYGRAVGVYLPYWKLGYRRRIGRKLAESGDGESFLLTLTARASFKQHSDGLGASLLYGIGI